MDNRFQPSNLVLKKEPPSGKISWVPNLEVKNPPGKLEKKNLRPFAQFPFLF